MFLAFSMNVHSRMLSRSFFFPQRPARGAPNNPTPHLTPCLHALPQVRLMAQRLLGPLRFSHHSRYNMLQLL
jgi:hypothetical protein